jgi:YidC/Oxa1 family membrane protein insertase
VDSGNGETGSFALEAQFASAALAPKPLGQVLWDHRVLSDEEGTVVGVEFTHRPGAGVAFRKAIRTRPGSYDIELEIGIENESASVAGAKQFALTPAGCVPGSSKDSFYPEPRVVAVWRRGGDDGAQWEEKQRDYGGSKPEGPLKAGGDVSFVGAHGKYFAALLREDVDSEGAILGARWRLVRDLEWAAEHPEEARKSWRTIAAELDVELFVPPIGAPEAVRRFILFAGPKDREVLAADHPDHAKLVEHDLGFFSGIAKILLFILGLFHSLTGNWGWSIILLTITVRSILFPMNRRSQTSMARHAKKMKRIQPLLDEIKERNKNDRRKQQQEQAAVMQKEGAMPPLGGCLPIFLQIPVFFGLFSALRTNFDLRHAPFHGWITDLSQPDRLMRLDVTLPLIGTIVYLNVLPPLMVVLWILQQKFMPTPTDPQQARMQKMMMWMPVMMGFFLYNYAAGLSLYMITQSALGIFEMGVIKKYWPLDDSEKTRKPSRFGRFLAEKQKQIEAMQRQSQGQSGGKGGGKGGQGSGKSPKAKRSAQKLKRNAR